MNHGDQVKSSKFQEKQGPLIKFKNVNSELSNISSKQGTHSLPGKKGTKPEVTFSRRNKYSSVKSDDDAPTMSSELVDDDSSLPSMSLASSEDHKTHLVFRIPKSSNFGNQNVQSNSSNGSALRLPGKEDITYSRGQRSKRRRPSLGDGDTSQRHEDNTIKEFTDANWILQKLGKDAAGKGIEIHQSSNNTW